MSASSKLVPFRIPLILMDVTEQFGCYDAFFEASRLPGVDQPVPPGGQWTHHGSLIPSGFLAPEYGFTNSVPPDPRFFHSYNPQSPILSDSFPSVIETSIGHPEPQDPVSIDWDVHSVLLDLTLTDADIVHLVNLPQQLRSGLDAPSSLLTGCGPPQAISPAPQNDTAQHSTFPTCVGESEGTIPRNTGYTSPTQHRSYMDIRGDGVFICLWRGTGEVYDFESGINVVKRHLRRMDLRSE